MTARINNALLKGSIQYRLALCAFATFTMNLLCIETTIASEPNWQAFATGVVEQHYLPAYNNFASAANTLSGKAKTFCSEKNNDNLTTLTDSYKSTLDHWQAIQHIDFGPITYAKRRPSIQYWPDKKGYVGKRMAELQAIKDSSEFKVELQQNFPQSRYAIGGINAIERLLFPLRNATDITDRGCQIILRHAQNLAQIGKNLAQEWNFDMLPQFHDPQQLDGFFEDDVDAATFVLKTLIEPIEGIRDQKILFPMGSEFGNQKYKRLESWRSQRSAQNVATNLSTIITVQTKLSRVIPSESMTTIAAHLKTSLNLLTEIGTFEEAIHTEAGYQKMRQLAEELAALRNAMEIAVVHQGIHLGFNSRDGD